MLQQAMFAAQKSKEVAAKAEEIATSAMESAEQALAEEVLALEDMKVRDVRKVPRPSTCIGGQRVSSRWAAGVPGEPRDHGIGLTLTYPRPRAGPFCLLSRLVTLERTQLSPRLSRTLRVCTVARKIHTLALKIHIVALKIHVVALNIRVRVEILCRSRG
eukprot:5444149-Pyramimonas_sp.AAC.1